MRAPFQPLIRAELDRVRATMRGQVALVFAPELAALGPDGAAVLAMLDVICPWEARDLLRGDQGLSDAAARAAATGEIRRQIARASCRERVCKHVSIRGVPVTLKKKS